GLIHPVVEAGLPGGLGEARDVLECAVQIPVMELHQGVEAGREYIRQGSAGQIEGQVDQQLPEVALAGGDGRRPDVQEMVEKGIAAETIGALQEGGEAVHGLLRRYIFNTGV